MDHQQFSLKRSQNSQSKNQS